MLTSWQKHWCLETALILIKGWRVMFVGLKGNIWVQHLVIDTACLLLIWPVYMLLNIFNIEKWAWSKSVALVIWIMWILEFFLHPPLGKRLISSLILGPYSICILLTNSHRCEVLREFRILNTSSISFRRFLVDCCYFLPFRGRSNRLIIIFA